MKFGFSGEAFGNLLVLSCLVASIVIIVVVIIAYKRGIAVEKHSFGLTLLLSCGFVFVILPFWLSDLSITWKMIGTFLMLCGGLGNYFAIDRMQRMLRKRKTGKNRWVKLERPNPGHPINK